MADIHFLTAENRPKRKRRKKEREREKERKKEQTTGQKYNGLPISWWP